LGIIVSAISVIVWTKCNLPVAIIPENHTCKYSYRLMGAIMKKKKDGALPYGASVLAL